MTKPLCIVILAAGKGSRLKSSKPKVCHKLAGLSLLARVIQTAKALNPSQCIVIAGYGYEHVQKICEKEQITIVRQKEQLGTAHAVACVLPELKQDSNILVLYGDVPLISVAILQKLLTNLDDNVGLILGQKVNPFGYGRVVRDDKHNVTQIVEQKDATDKQRKIKQIFSGIMAIPSDKFEKWYPQIKNDNAQNEYYLTDMVALAVQDKHPIKDILSEQDYEIQGVNDRLQLAQLERQYQQNMAQEFMRQGVTFCDWNRVDFRGVVTIGRDCIIDINVVLENTKVGVNTKIGANCVINNTTIADNVIIEPFTHIDGAIIESQCCIGPYARIRPNTHLKPKVKIGNFVEVKKSIVDSDSKINHLSYIGDSLIEASVNIGAGTITCNYDGVNKHQTIIKEGAFIGSGTQLIAPITIGKNATVGAGSTITKDAQANSLVLTRADQKTILEWNSNKKVKI